MKSDLIGREPVSTCHGDCGALTPEEAWKQLRPNLSILTLGGHIVSDLINKDALVEDFRRIARAQANAGIFVAADAWEGAADRLANAPAVDAEVVRYGRYDAGGDCTICGYPMPTDDRCDAIFPGEIKYCYNCGAKMDGDKHAADCGANGYCLYGERKTNVEV